MQILIFWRFLVIGPSVRSFYILYAIYIRGLHIHHSQVRCHRFSGFCDAIIIGGVIAICLILPNHAYVRNSSYIFYVFFIIVSHIDHCEVPYVARFLRLLRLDLF